MRIDELILLALLHTDEKKIEGRTLLQKSLYFLNEKLSFELEFIPYYYGPYNPKITEVVEGLVSSGIIEERTQKFTVNSINDYEPRRYTYVLTDIGSKIAEHIKKEHSDEAKRIKNELDLMKSFDYHVLSIAAKMHHILKIERKAITISEIMEEAKFLNWDITEKDADRALKFLTHIKVVKT